MSTARMPGADACVTRAGRSSCPWSRRRRSDSPSPAKTVNPTVMVLSFGIKARMVLPPGDRRELVAAVLVVAERARGNFAPAMSGHWEKLDADDQGGVEPGRPRQRPGAQGPLLARDGDGMAGNGGAHGGV